MMTDRSAHFVSLLAALVAGAIGWTGCGARDTSGLPTVPVTARVTHNGKPVEGAVVTFIGDGGHSASGITGTDGVARPWTIREGDGVVPGTYRVTVRKVTIEGDEGVDPMSGEEAGQVVSHLPARYQQADTTDLTATVSEDSTEFTFALTD